MVITRGKKGWGEVDEGKGVINGDGRRFDLGEGEHTAQYTDGAL